MFDNYSKEREQRVRTSPRISLNLLADYLMAKPARRRTILTEQKYPAEYKAVWYNDASNAIVDYLLGETEAIHAQLNRLYDAPIQRVHEQRKVGACIDALEAFLECDLDLVGLDLTRGDNDAEKLRIEGVDISVRPEILIEYTDRTGRIRTGALKLYFSKTRPLTEEGGAYVGTLLQKWVEENTSGMPDPKQVLVLDVFSRELYAAPKAVKRRMNDITAVCQEIVPVWDSL